MFVGPKSGLVQRARFSGVPEKGELTLDGSFRIALGMRMRMSYRLVMLWQELLKEPFKFYFGFRVSFIDSSFLAQISFATYIQ